MRRQAYGSIASTSGLGALIAAVALQSSWIGAVGLALVTGAVVTLGAVLADLTVDRHEHARHHDVDELARHRAKGS